MAFLLNKKIYQEFKIPLSVFLGIICYFLLNLYNQKYLANVIVLFVTVLGSFGLIKESISSLFKGKYVLDYIAILAIVVSLVTGEYLVAAVIALMISTGRTLEEYGANNAKRNLTNLVDRIPAEIVLWEKNAAGERSKINKVKIGQEILIRKGEVIALDGVIISEHGLTDESSLTGEPYEIDKVRGDLIRSGTVNIGNPFVMRVTKEEGDSTYSKIIEMVKEAQNEKAPLVRLADKYSVMFTVLTFLISVFAYLYSHELVRVLAVLVVATPCPLILATPIALIGGVNAASKKRIIVKKLAGIEALSRINSLIFDKTGTITLGVPRVSEFVKVGGDIDRKKILSIADAIERNSLHPLAKAIVSFVKEQRMPKVIVENISEIIGTGIGGELSGKKYLLSKLESSEGMSIGMSENGKQIAEFRFEDQIKKESVKIVEQLKKEGYSLYIFTGDKKSSADKVAGQLGNNVIVRAEMTPKQKQEGVEGLKKEGAVVAMIGDGINDAPALALADVGMVFSNEEQTAASEAADIVFLGGDFEHVSNIINISKRTVSIAFQSISWGIGASVIAMIFASLGYIPPIIGAGLQEAIDVAVIINALRAAKG